MKYAYLVFPVLCLASAAFGWGAGHDTVAKETLRVLPGVWGERLRGGAEGNLFVASCHAPDDQKTPLAARAEYLDAELRAALDEHKEKPTVLYRLHGADARCEMIRAMARAMKRGDPRSLAYLLACFNHSVADTVSANHSPLVQLVDCHWKAQGLEDRLETDCAVLEETAQARAIMKAAVDALDVESSDTTPAAVFKACYDDEQRGLDYFKYDRALAAGGEAAYRVLAAELAYAVRRTSEAVLAAAAFAALPEIPAFDVKSENTRAQEAARRFLLGRPIGDDALTHGLVPKEGRTPEIGVVYDPAGSWTRGFVYTGNKAFAAQICATLKKRRAAGLLDIRDVLANGVPKGVKTVVFPASGYGDYRGISVKSATEALARFMADGGRLVWVGGKPAPPPALFPEARGFVKNTVPNPWGHMRCPVAAVDMPGCSLLLPDGTRFACRRSPKGSAGWYWDHFSFDEMPPEKLPAGARTELAFIARDGRRTTVAYTVGNRTFLPAFALFPYVFTDETPQLKPLKLELDAAGAAVMESVLKP